MLCIYFLQQWYTLADEALEDAQYDSQALNDSVGIDLSRQNVSDANETNRRVRKDSPAQELKRLVNRAKSKVRSRVEHVFAVVKRLWGFNKVRYRGLATNGVRMLVVELQEASLAAAAAGLRHEGAPSAVAEPAGSLHRSRDMARAFRSGPGLPGAMRRPQLLPGQILEEYRQGPVEDLG